MSSVKVHDHLRPRREGCKPCLTLGTLGSDSVGSSHAPALAQTADSFVTRLGFPFPNYALHRGCSLGRRCPAGVGHGLPGTPEEPRTHSAPPLRPGPGPPASNARGEADRTRVRFQRPSGPRGQVSPAPAQRLPTAPALVPVPEAVGTAAAAAAAAEVAAPPLQRRRAERGQTQRWSPRGAERPRATCRRVPCRREALTAARPPLDQAAAERFFFFPV